MKIGYFKFTMDPLLPLVIVLMAWVLSERYYPELILSHDKYVYWLMGGVSSLFLTISIFIHELGHAFMAKRLRLPLERIHLFLFGGMAELKHRPNDSVQELYIAIAGPAASILFAGFVYLMLMVLPEISAPVYLVLQYIMYMNLLLGLFNLLPIFPLDGGRATRALIWSYNNKFHDASKITYKISIALISILLLMSLTSLLWEGLQTTFWLGLFSVYLGYTAYTGRQELTYQPELSDLIMSVSYPRNPQSIVDEVRSLDLTVLRKCMIPVLTDNELNFVIHGNDITINGSVDYTFEQHYQKVEFGHFIDILNKNTYQTDVQFKADYLPVLQNGFFMGLCDANELRFWLLQEPGK
ncbi:MAG: site-2 protease family protein [Balneolales bacterium]